MSEQKHLDTLGRRALATGFMPRPWWGDSIPRDTPARDDSSGLSWFQDPLNLRRFLPDFADPGTAAGLLPLVRRVRAEPRGFVLPPGALSAAWTYCGDANASPLLGSSATPMFAGASEVEALVLALEDRSPMGTPRCLHGHSVIRDTPADSMLIRLGPGPHAELILSSLQRSEGYLGPVQLVPRSEKGGAVGPSAVWGPSEAVDGAGLSLPAHADRLAALVLERGQLGGLRVLLDELRRCLIPAQRGLEQGDTRQVARSLQRLEAVTSALTRELSAHARIQP